MFWRFDVFGFAGHRAGGLVRPDKHAHHGHLRRIAGGMALLALIAGTLAYHHLTDPERVRQAAQRYLQDLVGAEVAVQGARFSLFGGVQLSRVWITEPGRSTPPGPGTSGPPGPADATPDARWLGAGTVFSCSDIRLKYRPISALLGRPAVEQIVATRPTLTIYRDTRTGRYNVAELVRTRGLSSSQGAPSLPTVRLRDARIRLGRRDGRSREIVEDLTLNLLASPAERAGVYDLQWEGGGAQWSQGRSRLDLSSRTITDVQGGLPWLSLEGAFLAAEAKFAGAQRWCELLGITGQLQVRDFNVSARTGEADPSRATIRLHRASLSIPLGEDEKALPPEQRYLRLDQVEGRLDFGTTEATAQLSGKLHDSDCTLTARLLYPPTDQPKLADLGFEVEISVERLRLPRRDDPQASAQARFIDRWRPVRHFYNDFDPHGLVSVQMSLVKPVGGDSAVELRYALLEGLDCDASHRLFPYRVCGLTGTVVYRPDGLTLHDLSGDHEGGRVTVNGTLTAPRWFAGADLHVTGRDLPIDRALHDALSPRYRRIWDQFELSGLTDLEIVMHKRDGTAERSYPWESTVEARLKDVSAEFLGFRYPLEGVTGRVRIDSDVLTITDLCGSSGRGTVTFDGLARFDGDGVGALNLELTGTNLAFGERLNRALPGHARRLVNRFAPEGTFDLVGSLTRDSLSASLGYAVQVALGGVGITYQELPVPLHDVRGHIGLTPGRITIDRLTGYYEQARVVAEGSVELAAEHARTDLRITCSNLRLDDALRDLLPEDLRRTWGTLNLAGVVDTATTLRQNVAGDHRPRVSETSITARGLSVRYDQFPLPVTDVNGVVTVAGNRVSFADLSGRYGQARLSMSGEVVRGADQVSGRLALGISQMPFSEDLRQALPWRLRRTWNNVGPQGLFDLDLTRLEFRQAGGGGPMQYDFSAVLTLHDVGLDVGARLRNLRGRVAGSGRVQDRGGLSFSGTVDLERADLNDRRLTGVTGRIDRSAVERTLLLSDLRGRAYGGPIRATVRVDHSSRPASYSCNLTVTDMQLQALLNARRAPEDPPLEVAGRADAHLFVTGQLGDPRSLHGGGRVSIEGACMFRLPLMLSVLDVLGLAAPENAAAQSATAEFFVLGRTVELRDILIRGNTMAMIGSGKMVRGPLDVDLRLVAVSPHRWFKLPVVTEFLEGAAGELVEITVQGPVSDPAVSATPLPSVGGALETLFGQRRPDRGGDSG